MLRTLRSIQKYLRPAVVSIATAGANLVPVPALALQQDGAVVNIGALVGALAGVSANAAPASLNPNYFALANAAGVTWNAATVPTGIVNLHMVRSGAAAVSDTTDVAWNIVAGMSGAFVGMTFPLTLVNLNSGLLTLVAGSGVTLAGTTTVATTVMRVYQGKVTQVTTINGYVVAGITGGTYSQAGNLVTLTLTGNTAAAPTVGQAIQLTPTSGALGTLNAAAWWPIISVASATSFVVFNPISQTTSGNVNTFTTGTVAPAVFNPLLTLQGMYASSAAFTA